ncbi:hypothetical protein ACFL15_01645 [Patescibacteria group bacterium]
MSEIKEFNIVVANSQDLSKVKNFEIFEKEINNNFRNEGINILLSTTSNISNQKEIIKKQPDVVLLINYYSHENVEQIKEDVGYVRKLRKRLPESAKIALFSNRNYSKENFFEAGIDLWISFRQIKKLPEIISKLYKEEQIYYEDVLSKDSLDK